MSNMICGSNIEVGAFVEATDGEINEDGSVEGFVDVHRFSIAWHLTQGLMVALIGDAAGMAPPLSGNGMSMALHGSQIAFRCIADFLGGVTARYELEQEYMDQWNRQFGRRLWMGRFLQRWFGREQRANLLLSCPLSG